MNFSRILFISLLFGFLGISVFVSSNYYNQKEKKNLLDQSISKNNNDNDNPNTASNKNIISSSSNDKKTEPIISTFEHFVSRNLLGYADNNNNDINSSSSLPLSGPKFSLDSNSVVLITGAAGFLGSELALALHRTYTPKKLLLLDSLEIDNALGEQFAKVEYKRQRIFHVLQTLGPRAKFYKCDLRPVIPEFFEVGEVPVLDTIFSIHQDITHVVHLANTRSKDPERAVPREREDMKAGMMEALLEQLRKVKEERNHTPHFIFGSSYEVYNTAQDSSPHKETDALGAPMSLYGTSKLLDEITAATFFNMYGISSVGLRFFEVYGPWGQAGTAINDLAEKIIFEHFQASRSSSQGAEEENKDSIPYFLDSQADASVAKDHVYIDDAVDALMLAMQYQNTKPVLFNVGTGNSWSLYQIAEYMLKSISDANRLPPTKPVSQSIIASMERSKAHLGYCPSITLENGLIELLAWHLDRSSPYGELAVMVNNPSQEGEKMSSELSNNNNNNNSQSKISSYGFSTCNPYDEECLRGAAVFPCISECAHNKTCFPSIYDTVVRTSREITHGCISVLYTVSLGSHVEDIPVESSHIVNPTEKSFCNIAFVSENSALIQKLKRTSPSSSAAIASSASENTSRTREKKQRLFYKFDFWTLIPVPGDHDTTPMDRTDLFLPKYSPRSFFSPTVKFAAYADPNVAFLNLPTLLKTMEKPTTDQGEVVMLVSSTPQKSSDFRRVYNTQEEIFYSAPQERAYNMIRVGLQGGMRFSEINTKWIIHTLKGYSDLDSRLFRCDVFGETILWNVTRDDSALCFISELHDFWTRKIKEWEDDVYPWWINTNEESEDRRRLQRNLQVTEKDEAFHVNHAGMELSSIHNEMQLKDQLMNKQHLSSSSSNHQQQDISSSNNVDADQVEWMAILTSTDVNYFVKILSTDMNVVKYVDDDSLKTK